MVGGATIMFRVSNSVYRKVSRYFTIKQTEICNQNIRR